MPNNRKKKDRFIFVVLLIIFILRIPFLLEPYWYGDEGIYLTIGQALRNGFSLYKDIFDNKPPLIYLLATIVNGNLFWFKFLLNFSVLASILLFYKFSKIFLITETKTKIVTIIFAFLTTARLLEGNIVNSELFILLPTIGGFYLLGNVFKEKEVSQQNTPLFLSFLGGLLLGLGFLLKAVALFDFLALLFFWLFLKERKKVISLKKEVLLTIFGYLTPFLFICLYFTFKGTFSYFWEACFIKMFGYLSSWQTGTHKFSIQMLVKSEIIIRGLILVFILLLIFWKKTLSENKILFLVSWFCFALFSATLSGRPYAHYLIQVVPPFSLIIGLTLEKNKRKILIGVLSLLFLALLRYRYWFYPTISYYLNFFQFITRKKNLIEYQAYFSKSLPKIYKVSEIVSAYSFSNDKIFIWSDDPNIYCLSKRLPASKFIASYHVIDWSQQDLVIKELYKNRPELIVINKFAPSFFDLEILIKENYFQIFQEENFLIYKKNGNS